MEMALRIVKHVIRLRGVVLSQAQDTSSWCGAYLSIRYVFIAWCLVKYRIRLHGVAHS